MRPSPPADLPALTSLRFVAAAMIFLFHLREFAPYGWLYTLAPGLNQGVSFFFVLSGFVLTHAHMGRAVSWRSFVFARLARIWPLHLLCLALLLSMMPLRFACGQALDPEAELATFALKAALLDAWAPVRATLSSWNSVSWSISVEMAFYAAFPLLLPALERRPVFTVIAAAALSGDVFAAGAGLPVYVNDRWALTLNNLGAYFPPARGLEFTLGMAACFLWRRWPPATERTRGPWTWLEAAILLGAGVWIALILPRLIAASGGAMFVWLRASGSAWLFAPLIAVFASGRGSLSRLLASRAAVLMGQASFAFYLVHVIVLRAMSFYFVVDPLVFSLAALALSLLLAFALHLGVEAPARSWLLGLARSRRRLPAPAEPSPAR